MTERVQPQSEPSREPGHIAGVCRHFISMAEHCPMCERAPSQRETGAVDAEARERVAATICDSLSVGYQGDTGAWQHIVNDPLTNARFYAAADAVLASLRTAPAREPDAWIDPDPPHVLESQRTVVLHRRPTTFATCPVYIGGTPPAAVPDAEWVEAVFAIVCRAVRAGSSAMYGGSEAMDRVTLALTNEIVALSRTPAAVEPEPSEPPRCESCGSSKVAGYTLDDVPLCPLCAPTGERERLIARGVTPEGADEILQFACRLRAKQEGHPCTCGAHAPPAAVQPASTQTSTSEEA